MTRTTRRSAPRSRSSWTGRSCRTSSGTQPEKAIPHEFWIEAGKQGFLGLEIPRRTAAQAGDYRSNAVLTEELAKVNMALPSCVGIHADIVAPYLVHLTTDEQKKRWLPGFCGESSSPRSA